MTNTGIQASNATGTQAQSNIVLQSPAIRQNVYRACTNCKGRFTCLDGRTLGGKCNRCERDGLECTGRIVTFRRLEAQLPASSTQPLGGLQALSNVFDSRPAQEATDTIPAILSEAVFVYDQLLTAITDRVRLTQPTLAQDIDRSRLAIRQGLPDQTLAAMLERDAGNAGAAQGSTGEAAQGSTAGGAQDATGEAVQDATRGEAMYELE